MFNIVCARRSSAGGGPFAARLGYVRHHGDLVEDAPFVNDFAFALSKILAANPDAIHNTNDSAWGPLGKFHHWGEPHFGYYLSDDAWVTETALEGELAARNVAAPPSLPCVARTATSPPPCPAGPTTCTWTTAPLSWASPTTASTPPGAVGPTGSPTHTHQGWRATRVPRSPTLTCGGSLTGSASEFGKPPTRSSHARSRGNAGNFPQGFRPCRDSGGPW